MREVARPHQCVARVVVQEPRRVDDPEQDGDAHDRPQRRGGTGAGARIRGDDSGRAPSVRPTASNVVIARVAALLLAARARARPRERGRRAARAASRPPAGKCARPAPRSRSRARSQGFQGPLGSALSPGGRRSSASRAPPRASTPPTSSTSRTRRRTGTVPYDSRRGIGEAVFYGVTFSARRQARVGVGRRAERRARLRRRPHAATPAGDIPVPNFPAGLAYGKTPRGDRIYVANNLGGVPRARPTRPAARSP